MPEMVLPSRLAAMAEWSGWQSKTQSSGSECSPSGARRLAERITGPLHSYVGTWYTSSSVSAHVSPPAVR